MFRKLISLLILLFIVPRCGYEQKGSEEYIHKINEWHKNRIERLKRENGWLNLVGLYWLDEGKNSFGSAESNDIIFPSKAPEKIGTITLSDSLLKIEVNQNVDVLIDSQLVKHSLRWFIIKRGEKYGVRLRDLEAPLVKNFEGVERFPVNVDWRVEAEFIPYDEPKELTIPTVLGTIEKDFAPGKLLFEVDGKEYSLDPIKSGEGFFILFADHTSGEETYGAGRYLYTSGPDENNKVILDFNKAYNPPCAFTKYATCPYPPKQNHLELSVTAGEKKFSK